MPKIIGKTITETFLERVRLTPDLVGFQYKIRPQGGTPFWKSITYKEFHDECRLVSYGLMALGAKPDDKIIIASNTRFEWTLTDMAILGARGITVPVYASSSADDSAYIIGHSDSVFVFVEDARQAAKLLSKRDRTPLVRKYILMNPNAKPQPEWPDANDVLTLAQLKDFGRELALKEPNRFEQNLRDAKPDDLMTICYTSGTTGVPKGAMIKHDSLMSVLDDCGTLLGGFLRFDTEIMLAFLPYSHILGKCESMGTFAYGWRECYSENFEKLMSNMGEICPTMIFAVPRIFEKAFSRIHSMMEGGSRSKRKMFGWAVGAGRKYMAAEWDGRSRPLRHFAEYQLARALVFKKIRARFGGRLRFAVCGGAPLPREIGEFFCISGVKILEGYGLTETCAPVAFNSPYDVRYGSVGRPLAEVKVKIADDGEICIKSRKVFRGYYKMPAETAEAMDGDWFHTGDIGYLDAEGYIHITDRKKDLIITSGGKNIAPQKIENMAKAYSFITQFVVHGDKRNYLTAVVTLDKDQTIRYAKENQIPFKDYKGLVETQEIRKKVQKAIDEMNGKLAAFETVRRFTILPDEFGIETGELTPSLKVKRNVVARKYQAVVESMYSNVP